MSHDDLLLSFPEHKEMFPHDSPDPGSLSEDDELKAHAWQSAILAVREFAAVFGLGATLRMVGAALDGQEELFK